MLADDDVGRIATQVPAVVSKCLELFASELVTKAAALVTDDDTGKTLQAAHIKKCIESDDLFDFLRSTVSELPEQGPKRLRATGGASGASKRGKTAAAAAGAAAADTAADGGAATGSSAFAGDYRQDVDDDDYDAQ